jgi:hypothetical protein
MLGELASLSAALIWSGSMTTFSVHGKERNPFENFPKSIGYLPRTVLPFGGKNWPFSIRSTKFANI